MSSSRRQSPGDAAQRALELAVAHLEAMDTRGWTWECGLATPDLLDSARSGKIPRRWIVPIHWSREGSSLDGPSIVIVDIESEEARVQAAP